MFVYPTVHLARDLLDTLDTGTPTGVSKFIKINTRVIIYIKIRTRQDTHRYVALLETGWGTSEVVRSCQRPEKLVNIFCETATRKTGLYDRVKMLVYKSCRLFQSHGN